MPPNKDLQGQQLEQKSCPWTMQQKMSQLRQEQSNHWVKNVSKSI